jgi:hypothetical protein
LKKHDKYLPNNPCKTFYVSRMHAQAWVRADYYSDLVVRFSHMYSNLREDHVATDNDDAAQSFCRSTTKYWVKTEDVSQDRVLRCYLDFSQQLQNLALFHVAIESELQFKPPLDDNRRNDLGALGAIILYVLFSSWPLRHFSILCSGVQQDDT